MEHQPLCVLPLYDERMSQNVCPSVGMTVGSRKNLRSLTLYSYTLTSDPKLGPTTEKVFEHKKEKDQLLLFG